MIQRDWEKVLLRQEYMKNFVDVGKDLNGIPPVHEVMSESEIKYERYIASLLYQIESSSQALDSLSAIRKFRLLYIIKFATGL